MFNIDDQLRIHDTHLAVVGKDYNRYGRDQKTQLDLYHTETQRKLDEQDKQITELKTLNQQIFLELSKTNRKLDVVLNRLADVTEQPLSDHKNIYEEKASQHMVIPYCPECGYSLLSQNDICIECSRNKGEQVFPRKLIEPKRIQVHDIRCCGEWDNNCKLCKIPLCPELRECYNCRTRI